MSIVFESRGEGVVLSTKAYPGCAAEMDQPPGITMTTYSMQKLV